VSVAPMDESEKAEKILLQEALLPKEVDNHKRQGMDTWMEGATVVVGVDVAADHLRWVKLVKTVPPYRAARSVVKKQIPEEDTHMEEVGRADMVVLARLHFHWQKETHEEYRHSSRRQEEQALDEEWQY